jgi:hypothetical protein
MSKKKKRRKVIVRNSLGLPRTRLGKQVPGSPDHGQLSWTRTFGGDLREDVSGCHLDFQSFILFFFYVYSLVSLLWLVYIVKPLYYYSSVLKSTSFTPNSFPQSFLSIPDLCCPSEIKTFRCYEGTAHKLRPSPFGIHLQSPEPIILLTEPHIDSGRAMATSSKFTMILCRWAC